MEKIPISAPRPRAIRHSIFTKLVTPIGSSTMNTNRDSRILSTHAAHPLISHHAAHLAIGRVKAVCPSTPSRASVPRGIVPMSRPRKPTWDVRVPSQCLMEITCGPRPMRTGGFILSLTLSRGFAIRIMPRTCASLRILQSAVDGKTWHWERAPPLRSQPPVYRIRERLLV